MANRSFNSFSSLSRYVSRNAYASFDAAGCEVFWLRIVGSKRGSLAFGPVVVDRSMTGRLRVTARLVDWMAGACFDTRDSFSFLVSFDLVVCCCCCFCSRAVRIRARISSSGEAVDSVGEDWWFVLLDLGFFRPREAWAFARAPKEMVFIEDWMSLSEFSSSSISSPCSGSASPSSSSRSLPGFDCQC